MNPKKIIRSSFNLKHIISLIAAMIFIVAAMILYSENIASSGNYIHFLKTRNYKYSVIISGNLSEDTYALYGKSITFSNSKSLSGLMNCITLMETQNTHTENDFLSGSSISRLKKNEVAISSNLARKNNVGEGDILYSKNKYNDKVEQYMVREVLPEIYGLGKEDTSLDSGILIIGYDKDYMENIRSEYIYFYNEEYSLINDSGAAIVGDLNITADTLKAIAACYAIYSTITMLLMLLVDAALFFLIWNFNSEVYRIRKQFGTKNLYGRICLDYGLYAGVLVIASSICYLVCTIRVSFAFEELMFEVLSVVFTSSIGLATAIRKVRRQ